MSNDGYTEEEDHQISKRSGKRGGGSGGESAPSADSTGGRSTGAITGFGGGKIGGSGSSGAGGSKGGAVAKANYSKAGGASSAKSIKASARYYTTRENERGESMEREAFSKDHDELSRGETYERLERADQEHEYHYRVAISPGTDREAEGVDLKEYTREVMYEIERQQRGGSSWVAVEHSRDTAHTERAHVHVIVSTDQKMNRDDLNKLRDQATRSWDDARDYARSMERDPTIERDIQQMARAQEQRQYSRENATREPTGHERVERDSGREAAPREREAPARNAQPASTQRPPDRPQERDYERDGGRGR